MGHHFKYLGDARITSKRSVGLTTNLSSIEDSNFDKMVYFLTGEIYEILWSSLRKPKFLLITYSKYTAYL